MLKSEKWRGKIFSSQYAGGQRFYQTIYIHSACKQLSFKKSLAIAVMMPHQASTETEQFAQNFSKKVDCSVIMAKWSQLTETALTPIHQRSMIQSFLAFFFLDATIDLILVRGTTISWSIRALKLLHRIPPTIKSTILKHFLLPYSRLVTIIFQASCHGAFAAAKIWHFGACFADAWMW